MKFNLMEENELEKRARKNRKTDKKGARGWFVHPNPGDPKTMQSFNNSTDGMPAMGEGVMNEMAMRRADAIEKCNNLGKQFVAHFDKIYNEIDEKTIKHHGEEMQAWFEDVRKIKLKDSNRPINEKQLYDWFITVNQLPIDLFDSETEAEVYDDFGNDLLDFSGDVLTSLRKMDLLHDEDLTEATANMTAQDKTELKNLLNSTNDPNVVVAFLQTKEEEKNKNEELTENSNKYRRVKKALFGDKNGRIKTFAILSPCNPNGEEISAEENNKRVKSFKKTLNDGHIPYTQFKGQYGSPEKSFLIIDVSQEQARHFAELYDQQSFFWGTNNVDKNSTISYYERRSPNSPVYELIETSDRIEDASDAEDFFSKYADVKFQIKMDYFEDFNIPPVDEELLEKSFNTTGFNSYVNRAKAYRKAKEDCRMKESVNVKLMEAKEDYDPEFLDRYSPIVDIKNKSRYDVKNYGSRKFAYDKNEQMLIYVFQDDDEKLVLGNSCPWRELSAQGLSISNWKDDPNYWCEVYSDELDSELSYMMSDLTYDEFKPENNTKSDDTDTKKEIDGEHEDPDFGFVNGSLNSFNPQELMDKVKSRASSLFTSRVNGDTLYDISVHFHDIIGRIDENTTYDVRIIREDRDGNQEYETDYDEYSNLTDKEVVDKLNDWKRSVLS